jgi:hypothetical protein
MPIRCARTDHVGLAPIVQIGGSARSTAERSGHGPSRPRRRKRHTVVIIGVVVGVARSHQLMASASAVMRSRSSAMNSACVPPPRAKQNFQSSAAVRWVVVDRLIHGVGVDLSGAVAVDRCPDVAEQFGQLRLVVGADPFTRGAPFGIRGHDGDATVSGRGGRDQSSPVVPDAGADQPGAGAPGKPGWRSRHRRR